MPKIPSDFQNLADAANGNQKWRDIVPLWDFTVQRDSLFATNAAQHPAKPWPMDKIRAAFSEKNRRSPSVRAKRKGTPAARTAGGSSPRPGQAMQRQQLHEMTLCAPEDLFFRDNGSDDPAPVLDAVDFGHLATGVCVMSLNKSRAQVRQQIK